MNSSIPGALSPVLEKLSPPYFLAQLTTSGSSMMLKVLLDKVFADIKNWRRGILSRVSARFYDTDVVVAYFAQFKTSNFNNFHSWSDKLTVKIQRHLVNNWDRLSS